MSESSNRDAYEGLLLDVIEGDHSLFLRSDEVEHSWRIVDPILKHWETEESKLSNPLGTYAAGSWGIQDAEKLFVNKEHGWRFSVDPDEL